MAEKRGYHLKLNYDDLVGQIKSKNKPIINPPYREAFIIRNSHQYQNAIHMNFMDMETHQKQMTQFWVWDQAVFPM